jgi:hypothetical protein
MAIAQPEEYYPERALRACAAGRVKVHCTAQAEGKLTACAVVSETPAGMGFGDATLSATRIWKIRSEQAFERTVVWLPPPDCGATWLRAQGAYYPEAALRGYVSGRTTAQCDVGNDGRPRNCKILAEQPLGYGFGEATVRMYQTGVRMRVTPEIARGGTVITRTVVWNPPPSPTQANLSAKP